ETFTDPAPVSDNPEALNVPPARSTLVPDARLQVPPNAPPPSRARWPLVADTAPCRSTATVSCRTAPTVDRDVVMVAPASFWRREPGVASEYTIPSAPLNVMALAF